MGCYFKDAPEIEVALKIVSQDVVSGGFHNVLNYANASRNMWLLKDSGLKVTVSKGFLVLPNLRYGSCRRNFLSIKLSKYCDGDHLVALRRG